MKTHYEIHSEPSPEYRAGVLSGRLSIYKIVEMDGDNTIRTLFVFDGEDSSQSRRDAYEKLTELEAQRQNNATD